MTHLYLQIKFEGFEPETIGRSAGTLMSTKKHVIATSQEIETQKAQI